MILRKPYAIFIRLFKPIHFIVTVLIGYLILLESKILNFLSEYINSNTSMIGTNVKDQLVNKYIFIIPVIIMALSLFILGIMVRKKKPSTFYFVNALIFLVILIINYYASNFLGTFEVAIVPIKMAKLIHDLVSINIIIESVTLVLFLIRGTGLDFKKFDFGSDISKFDISDEDKEEFEVELNLDISEVRRKRKYRLRNLKYKYEENKFLIIIGIFLFLALIGGLVFFILNRKTISNIEGVLYSLNGIDIKVENSYIVTKDFEGNSITDDYIIVVDSGLKLRDLEEKIYWEDFNLVIEDVVIRPTNKYNNSLLDLGNFYDDKDDIKEYSTYLFVYDLPEKYITSDLYFSHSGSGNKIKIKIEPKQLESFITSSESNLGDELSLNDALNGISFMINSYDIVEKVKLNYNYCMSENDCIPSVEYLAPSLDQDYDKTVLVLGCDYKNNGQLDLKSFYALLNDFGDIYYEKNGTWHVQKDGFEELKSNKTSAKNIYIGVNSDIESATAIKFVFNIRNYKYEYLLK